MQNKTQSLLMALLAEKPVEISSQEELRDILLLAKKHKIGAFAISAITGRCSDEKTLEDVKHELSKIKGVDSMTQAAIVRDVLVEKGIETTNTLFNGSAIKYCLLKGVHMRKRYPKTYLRQLTDIDILVADMDETLLLLKESGIPTEKMNGSVHAKISHGISLDIHESLGSEEITQDAWQSARSSGENEYAMSNEFEYFYHIYHAVKHIKNGGCGIRPILDLTYFPQEKENPYIVKYGLTAQEEALRTLSLRWFKEGRFEGSALEEFILNGGAHGTFRQRAQIGRAESKGYAIKKIFISREELRLIFPQARGLKIPKYQIKRWAQILKRRKLESIASELLASEKTADESAFWRP